MNLFDRDNMPPVGTRVRLRNGEITAISEIDVTSDNIWPVKIEGRGWYEWDGSFSSVPNHPNTIVEVLSDFVRWDELSKEEQWMLRGALDAGETIEWRANASTPFQSTNAPKGLSWVSYFQYRIRPPLKVTLSGTATRVELVGDTLTVHGWQSDETQ